MALARSVTTLRNVDHINSTSMPSTIGPLRVASRNDAAKCAEAGIPSRGDDQCGLGFLDDERPDGGNVLAQPGTRQGRNLLVVLPQVDRARAWACRRYLRAAIVEIRSLRRGAHRNNAPVDDLDFDFALH